MHKTETTLMSNLRVSKEPPHNSFIREGVKKPISCGHILKRGVDPLSPTSEEKKDAECSETENMYFVKTILDLLICISENVKKKHFFGGVRKKNGFCRTGGGGSERYGHVHNLQVFYALDTSYSLHVR